MKPYVKFSRLPLCTVMDFPTNVNSSYHTPLNKPPEHRLFPSTEAPRLDTPTILSLPLSNPLTTKATAPTPTPKATPASLSPGSSNTAATSASPHPSSPSSSSPPQSTKSSQST
ncbi:hypothetical protein L207DRAFT_520439 [Hyaloscypha variabilis F]|uniref:Uncharacterized protein n=1 Tax=Hyaloscypha variabilis (strain UAMH 11265 / GT02V1 / F) TaxID=1149755 RepID=A0A2J6QUV3_HYAVF|nr:hypothetical protein L207DRAFT_520439 [Hyaloscypha variabilis F]